NIMCSKRCAKPVRPAFSLAGPTWYQMFTETSGRVWSSERTTSKPFFNLYFSNGMVGSFRDGDCASAGWPEAKANSNSRLPNRRTFLRNMIFPPRDAGRRSFPGSLQLGTIRNPGLFPRVCGVLVYLAEVLQEKLGNAIHQDNSRGRVRNAMATSGKGH